MEWDTPSKDMNGNSLESTGIDNNYTYNQKEQIEDLETQIDEINTQLSAPDFYQKPADEITKVQDALAKCEAELEVAFERWETLDNLA